MFLMLKYVENKSLWKFEILKNSFTTMKFLKIFQ